MSRKFDYIRKKDERSEIRFICSSNLDEKEQYFLINDKPYSEVKKMYNTKPKLDKNMPAKTTITVNHIAEEWLQEIKSYKKYSTYVKYRYIYDNHIKPYIGNKKVNHITESECIDLITNEYCHANNQLSISTMSSIRNVLTQIMNCANNPITISSDLYKYQSVAYMHLNSIDIFSKEEQCKLHTYLLEDLNCYKLGIYICMMTGLRLGEICALKTKNIDIEKKVIIVNQTTQRIKSEKKDCKTELIITNPKTIHSLREIPICDVLMDILIGNLPSSMYLVNGEKIMEPRTYQYYFHRILELLSIRDRNFHSLRHTFATNCIDSGMDPKCLSEILGHSDVKITLNRYVHPTLEQKLKQLNSFASNYGHINGHI